MDTNVAITLCFIVILLIAIWGMLKIRKGWIDEQGSLAANVLIASTEGYYLCGVPLSTWVKQSIAMKLRWYGVADFARAFGEELTYALSKKDLLAIMYYRLDSSGHYEVIVRFSMEGDTWQYRVVDPYGWCGELKRVPKRGRESYCDIEGFDKTDYLAPWMKIWRERWDPCMTPEGSMGVAPDSIRVNNANLTDFVWAEHADRVKERILGITK